MYKIIGYMLNNGDGCKWLPEPITVDTLIEVARFESDKQHEVNCTVDDIYQTITK